MRTSQPLKCISFLSFLGHVYSASSTTGGPSCSTLEASTAQATVIVTAAAATPTSNRATFPPVGSIPKDFSPAGLERIWDLIGGPVSPPPFTTTRVPQTPIPVPSPPALYPDWFSPRPSNLLPNLKFPKGFLFGVATAAYQVEGAAKTDGKGPTIWDWNSRQPGGVGDNSTGDVVDLQYYLYKEDVARVAALGVNAHSLSISWARIFPFGTADSPVNQAGLDHYSELIDYHLQSGVEPVVTLFHWDTPLALHAYYGGFMSPESVDDFVHYAKTVFKAYNGRVKTWITFNEPRGFCGFFGSSQFTFGAILPSPLNTSTAPYHCIYNILRAHAGAVKAFREMKIEGQISFKSENFIGPPWRANSTDDAEASERHTAFQIGIFADPVFVTGDWPKILTDTLPPSYLPRLTEEEKKDVLGSADFFAIDAYRVQYVRAPPEGLAACVANSSHPNWPTCNIVVQFDSTTGWAVGPSADWLLNGPASIQATPTLMRPFFRELHRRWPTNKMYISEFGFIEPFEQLRTELFRITEDVTRTNYYMTYVGEVLLAIHEDKLPIAGVIAWAMIDNAEWNSGLSARFGIQHVNYTTLERTYKRSALSLAEFFKAHLLG